jgi:hypothetical protein
VEGAIGLPECFDRLRNQNDEELDETASAPHVPYSYNLQPPCGCSEKERLWMGKHCSDRDSLFAAAPVIAALVALGSHTALAHFRSTTTR